METGFVALCESLAKECESFDPRALAPETCVELLSVLGTAKLQLEGVRVAVIGHLAALEQQLKRGPRNDGESEPEPGAVKGKVLGESHSIWESVERTGKQSPKKVGQEVRRAQAVHELYPRFGQAMRAGKISGDYVDVLQSAFRSGELKERAAQSEEWFLERALSQSVEQFRKSVQAWRFRNSPRSAEAQAQQDSRSEVFRVSRERGGYRLSGWLGSINGAIVHRAIAQEIGVPSRDDDRSPGQRGADALLDLIHVAQGGVGEVPNENHGGEGVHGGQGEHGGHSGSLPGSSQRARATGTSPNHRVGARYQMLVHVPLETLVQTELAIETGCGHLNHLEHVLQGDMASNVEDQGRAGGHPFAGLPPCPVSGQGIGGQGQCLNGRGQLTAEVGRELGRTKALIKAGVCPDALKDFEPATLTDGTPLAPSQLARMACSSGISRVVFSAHGEPLDASRSQRRFSSTQEKAIISRDRSCRYPGCGRGLEMCEIHHAHTWHDGGATTTDNGLMLCFHHHQYIHSEHIIITHHAGGFVFTRPNGTVVGIRRHESGVDVTQSQRATAAIQEGMFDMSA